MTIKRILNFHLTLFILLFLGTSFAFSFLVIKNFSSPLAGNFVDTNQWEYIGFYFLKNLRILPFTQIYLVNNQVFYPYGTNSVFQSWGIERDIFYSILFSIFGIGPWLQLYYLLTVMITALGAFVLLIRDYGVLRASGVGILITFCNFYAIHKYPAHLCYAVVHWTTLGLIADFLLVKRVVLKQHISLRLLLIRVCLLFLSFGQDLGYIAGFALTSFTVSIIFIIGLFIYRYFRGQFKLNELFVKAIETYKIDFLNFPRLSIVLIGITLIVAYIYLPLVVQLAREAKSFNFIEASSEAINIFDLNRTPQPLKGWWTSAYRLLIPFLPGFNPKLHFEEVLRDAPEDNSFEGSPGWFLLIIGSLGLWQARKHLAIFIPLLIIFLLCLFYHPENIPTIKRLFLVLIGILFLLSMRKRTSIFLPLLFVLLCWLIAKDIYLPTLKIFPWFSFNRVPGRSTVIYSTILVLFALEINLSKLIVRKKLLSTFLITLICLETYTAYSLAYSWAIDSKPYSFDKNFFNYMNYVKEQPGEAVLDWPFCVIGGNGVGYRDGLCPYWRLNGSIYALRRFHEKKVMGQYFGRLHPSQVESYLQAGWDKLFVPDRKDMQAKRQKRCFSQQEWSFFTDFYKFNDFAGINLYTDLLLEDCLKEFYSRFGTPAMKTVVPGAGHLEFIPKPLELRRQVNLVKGMNLKFSNYVNYVRERTNNPP